MAVGFTFLAFFAVSGGLFYASRGIAREELYKECNNATSYIHMADALYVAANSKLCTAACPCNADAELWKDYLATQAQSSTPTTTSVNNTAKSATTNPLGTVVSTGTQAAATTTNVAKSLTLITSESGVDRF